MERLDTLAVTRQKTPPVATASTISCSLEVAERGHWWGRGDPPLRGRLEAAEAGLDGGLVEGRALAGGRAEEGTRAGRSSAEDGRGGAGVAGRGGMEIGRQAEEDEGGRGEVEQGREVEAGEGGRELTSAEVDVILTRISANVELTFFYEEHAK